MSKNSDKGLRLANLEAKDCDRTPANLSERLSREVRASMGICIRAIMLRRLDFPRNAW